MFSSVSNRESEPLSKTALFFLALVTITTGYAIVFAAGPVAQSHGDLRTKGLISILLAGILGGLFCFTIKSSPPLGAGLDTLIFLLPAYGFFQVIPLPLRAVRFLSPARAELADSLNALLPASPWVPLSAAPSATFYHSLLLAACAIVFIVISRLSARLILRPWLVMLPLIFMAAGEAVIGLLQVASAPDAIATGTYPVRNHFAGFLEMLLPFAALYPFAALSHRPPDVRHQVAPAIRACFGLIVSALLLAAIVLSLSRMGFITALLSMVSVIIVATSYGRPRRTISLIAAGVLVAALFALLFVPSARLVTRFGDMQKNAESRTPLRESLHLAAAYPLFGCGLGAYEPAFLKYKRSEPGLNQDYAHNDYLQYLAELGILGFLAAAVPISMIVIRLAQACRDPRPALRLLSLASAGSLLAIALHSFVDFNLYVPANMLILAWILGVAARMGKVSAQYRAKSLEPVAVIRVPPILAQSKPFR
jgi:O-antigen ligase